MSDVWPELRPEIEVHASAGDLGALWDRFEVFEAIHHSQRICNPMTEHELAEVLAALNPAVRASWLDVACGSGEMLIQAAEAGATETVGLDLSPWMLNGAARQSADRLPHTRRPQWHLAEAAAWPVVRRYEVVTCIGAEWIWHGMHSTIAALAERVEPGGLVAFGGPRLHFDADPEFVSQVFGSMDTADEVEQRFAECGFDVRSRIDPGEAGWRSYLTRGNQDVQDWARRHPGLRGEQWIADQQEWVEHYERDREVVGWSVWIAQATVSE